MNLLELTIQNSYCHEYLKLYFKAGINYITGENESGKSEALSMIPYALYGIVGLRGGADSYKKLKVTLIFKVYETLYQVERGSSVTLHRIEGKKLVQIATSTTAVNQAICNLLYEFDVFALTNYTEQSESEAYNKMKKSERIQFVEKASGIEEAKLVEKHLESLKKTLNTSIKTTKENLQVSPIDFTPNESYDISLSNENYISDLKNQTLVIYNEIQRLVKIQTLLQNRPVAPVFEFEDLSYESTIQSKEELRKQLESFPSPTVLQSADIQQKQLLADITSYSSKLINTEYTMSVLYYTEELEKHKINSLYFKVKELEKAGTITCPHCTSEFHLAHSAISDLEAPSQLEHVETTLYECEQGIKWQDVKKSLETKLENAKAEYKKIEHLKYDEYKALSKRFEKVHNVLERFTSAYRLFESSLSENLKQVENYELNFVNVQITELKLKYEHLTNLREELSLYAQKKAGFDARNVLVTELEKKLKDLQDEYKVVTELLISSKQIKLNIQQQFIPELNSKASKIVNHITSGKRAKLEITNDFLMMLDNHDIKLYSGSAKVISNIAFRLAYIETFYDKSFPVFIGDEIDCYFDKVRAAELHKVFERLISKGYQIILVSHFEQTEGNILNVSELKALQNDQKS